MVPSVDDRGEGPCWEGVCAVGGGDAGGGVVVDADTPAGQGLDKYDIYLSILCLFLCSGQVHKI